MRILCPSCGERSVHEFAYHGDAGPTRPITDVDATVEATTDSDWMRYVYLRDNSAGLHREFWYHAGGCRAWLVVTRDVTTHRITIVEAVR
jgi:methylglutamate dehydrogenase subunit B